MSLRNVLDDFVPRVVVTKYEDNAPRNKKKIWSIIKFSDDNGHRTKVFLPTFILHLCLESKKNLKLIYIINNQNNLELKIFQKRIIFIYFPIQKSLNITSRISSDEIFPVIFPISFRAHLKASEARTTSPLSDIPLYWSRYVRHLVRWDLCRACVKLGCALKGFPHLEI